MRKILIAAVVVLLSATAQAQETTPPTPAASAEQVDVWRYAAIGAGALAGIWAANVLTAGVIMPVMAGGVGMGVGGMGADVGLFMATRSLLVIGGAVVGGYAGAWLYDG